MPAGIIAGFQNFLQPILRESFEGITVWSGEIPRFDTSQEPVQIDGTFPAFRVTMDERGLDRTWTTEDPYGDKGPIYFQCWGTTLESVVNPPDGMLDIVEAALCDSSNWSEINLPGGPSANPYSVWNCLFKNWFAIQIEGARTQQGNFIFMGQIIFEVDLHGATPTR